MVIFAAGMQASKKVESAFDDFRLTRSLDYAEFAVNSRNRIRLQYSILRHTGINFIRPREDPAFEVEDFAETGLAQEIHGFP